MLYVIHERWYMPDMRGITTPRMRYNRVMDYAEALRVMTLRRYGYGLGGAGYADMWLQPVEELA